MSVKITCLQLDIAFGNPTKNRKYIQQKMTEALKENPDILVLPELWDTAYDLTRLDEIADDEGQQAKQLISQFAKTNEVNIVAGSIAKKQSKASQIRCIFSIEKVVKCHNTVSCTYLN